MLAQMLLYEKEQLPFQSHIIWVIINHGWGILTWGKY